MKKFALTVLALFAFCAANAQKVVSGDLNSLAGVSRLTLTVDYSDVKIWGLNEADFLEWHLAGKSAEGAAKWKEYWHGQVKDAFARTYISTFLDSQLPGRRIFLTSTPAEDPGYSMVVRPTSIDERDNVFADISILAPDGTECVRVSCKGRACRTGSFEHRTRVAFAKLGEMMGEFLTSSK